MDNKRVLFVEVETINPENKKRMLKRVEGLAIKGKVSRKGGSTQAEAQVSISNLPQEDIQFLTTYSSPYMKPKTKKLIRIYAGYEKTGWGQIFSGDIEEAIPADMPDTWLNIKAKSLFYANRTPLSFGVSNVTSKDLAQSIAKELGLNFEWQATSKKTFDQFQHTGSKTELIRQYNKLDEVTMYEDNGVLRVVDKVQNKPSSDKGVKLINKDTGMIGMPEPDQYGVKVQCLLDASLNLSKWIKVETVKLPTINGYYQIYDLDFDFANREQTFYCNIYAKTNGVL